MNCKVSRKMTALLKRLLLCRWKKNPKKVILLKLNRCTKNKNQMMSIMVFVDQRVKRRNHLGNQTML
ncbi:hypothetical protein MtrunA17_Chr4g0056831 [Medicago truncatula]|uniref:Uncharacterized protein n=1 Tax=Medicago truncatula TaxID=3880 RepID=A0A396IES6_MEDTR|nr:hypothetical protein MtrunA17_Chr4g0056831 [Medicago truncatula]